MAYNPLAGKAVPLYFIDGSELTDNGGDFKLDGGPYLVVYPVNGVSGATLAMDDITDVADGTPADGYILIGDGTWWSSVNLGNYALIHEAFAGAYEGLLRRTDSGYDVIKCNFSATTAPTLTDDADDDYTVGSIWLDVTNERAYICIDATSGNAIWKAMSGAGGGSASLAYSQTLDGAVANTTDETTLMSAGRGSKFIAADSLEQGAALRITAAGVLGTTGTPTLNLKLYLNATEICATGAVTMGSGLTDVGWGVLLHVVFRDTGVSGDVIASGYFERDDGSIRNVVKLTTVTVDTTEDLEVILTATWGTADPANTIVCQILKVESFTGEGMAPVGPTALEATEV